VATMELRDPDGVDNTAMAFKLYEQPAKEEIETNAHNRSISIKIEKESEWRKRVSTHHAI
jgi:hypothetical protein